jgi:hypothetical protein
VETLHASCRHLIAAGEIELGERREAAQCSHAHVRHLAAVAEVERRKRRAVDSSAIAQTTQQGFPMVPQRDVTANPCFGHQLCEGRRFYDFDFIVC